jgi:hypothetical protein
VVFLAAVPLALIAFAVTWLLPERPLRATAHIGVEEVEEGLLVDFGQVLAEDAPDLMAGSQDTSA